MSFGRIVPFGLAGGDRRVHRLGALQRIRNARHVWFRRLFDHSERGCKTNTSVGARIHGGQREC